ncbi:MAG: T9SS type A sorting domain-containing protein [Bacteroidales bacterium]|jgi:hypothetical protein|nr:T9SS type A sorting domain-containing protein [Bacteroidales bacterium]
MVFIVLGFVSVQAQEKCDTLKLEVINSYHLNKIGTSFSMIGNLDGTEIDIYEYPVLYMGMSIHNISNDTFLNNSQWAIFIRFQLFADTGAITSGSTNYGGRMTLGDILPDDTLSPIIIPVYYTLSDLIIELFVDEGITINQITHCRMIFGISYTDRDGYYTDSVIYAGADTAIFRIYDSSTGIDDIVQTNSTIYPNPAQTQFTVTDASGATVRMYNMLGQEVARKYSTEENAIIEVEHLPQGIYVLKIEKDKAVFTKKVEIVR